MLPEVLDGSDDFLDGLPVILPHAPPPLLRRLADHMPGVRREWAILVVLDLEPPRMPPLIGGRQWRDDVLKNVILVELDAHAADVDGHPVVCPDPTAVQLHVEEVAP